MEQMIVQTAVMRPIVKMPQVVNRLKFLKTVIAGLLYTFLKLLATSFKVLQNWGPSELLVSGISNCKYSMGM